MKTKNSKSREIGIFTKGLVHGFGQKLVIFLDFDFRENKKMVFYWLEKLLFFLEDHQTLFKAYFVQRLSTKNNSLFLTKIMG